MRIVVADIETIKSFFLIVVYDPILDAYFEFEVSERKCQIDKFVNFVEVYKDHYWVTYNGLKFDGQVIEYLLRNYQFWVDKSCLEICEILWQKGQDVIDDSNYDVFPQYREEELSLKQIDLFELAGFSNKFKRVSLKRLEFEMNLPDIEELPIKHDAVNLTNEECDSLVKYCSWDVKATYEFYKITIGDTEHPLYKENNQIQLRLDIEEEFGIKCLNYSDVKIGDEMIKKYYCQEKRIDYKDLPKKGTFRKEIRVADCIARYIKFQTPELKAFLNRIKLTTFSQKDDFKESIKFYGNTYSFMRGGLHTENKPEIFEATENKLIIDLDVSSYYPAIIINNKRYPAHLGKEFLRGYEHMFNKRLELKPLAKNDKRIAGIVAALKLSVNSVFGKSSDMQSWMYDRLLTIFTTITGELTLMMLIEALELRKIHVISANTDGIAVIISPSQENLMNTICEWWMGITKFELERTDYKKIVFSTVNDYLAIKTNDEIKRRGDFLIDMELYKNRSNRIIPIALSNYFVDGISVSDTIKSHTNIYDFCIRQKASKDFHYEGKTRINGNEITNVYNKLIRYYVSKDGEKLYKIKNESCQTNAPERSQIEAGKWLCTVCNYLPKTTKVSDCNLNYEFYITKTEDIIVKIDKYYKRTEFKVEQQLSLW
jgi:DNA polymerase elongation subunit (family B)